MDKLQQVRDEIGSDPDKALEALERVSEWISKELPIPTPRATLMLVRVNATISLLKNARYDAARKDFEEELED